MCTLTEGVIQVAVLPPVQHLFQRYAPPFQRHVGAFHVVFKEVILDRARASRLPSDARVSTYMKSQVQILNNWIYMEPRMNMHIVQLVIHKKKHDILLLRMGS